MAWFSNASFAAMPLSETGFNYIDQPYDQSIHLQVLGGYRPYSGNIAQFLKRDSYSPFGGGMLFNRYGYASGNPILRIDQSGHTPLLACVVGAVVVLGVCAQFGAKVGSRYVQDKCYIWFELDRKAGVMVAKWQEVREAIIRGESFDMAKLAGIEIGGLYSFNYEPWYFRKGFAMYFERKYLTEPWLKAVGEDRFFNMIAVAIYHQHVGYFYLLLY